MLLEDSVGQLRWLNRQACVYCGTIDGATPGATIFSANVALETLSRTDDRHQAVRQLDSNFLRPRSQCPQENFWTTARFRTDPSGTSF